MSTDARTPATFVTRMDYRPPGGNTVASIVLEGADHPDDIPVWVLILPDRIVKHAGLLHLGERQATEAETEQDARVCLDRAGAAIVAWADRERENNQTLDRALDFATSQVGIQQGALPLDDDDDENTAPRCHAHGIIACEDCSRTRPPGTTGDSGSWIRDDGSCRGCGYYGSTGMHRATCPARVR